MKISILKIYKGKYKYSRKDKEYLTKTGEIIRTYYYYHNDIGYNYIIITVFNGKLKCFEKTVKQKFKYNKRWGFNRKVLDSILLNDEERNEMFLVFLQNLKLELADEFQQMIFKCKHNLIKDVEIENNILDI